MSELNQIRSTQPIRPLKQEHRAALKKKSGKKKKQQRNKPTGDEKARVDEYI